MWQIQSSVVIEDDVVSEQPTATSSNSTTAVNESATNVYRNDEWGFGFEYSDDWRVSENSFSGYYTQFSLTLFPVEGKYYGRPVLIHIVESEFVDNSFKNLDKTEETIEIDGISGVKYTYDWKGDTQTAVIVPIEEYQMILGTNGRYPELYDDFIESFEFIE